MAADGALSGLVTSTTSLSAVNERLIEVDRCKTRLLRMRKSILTGSRLLVEEAKRGGFRGKWALLTATYRNEIEWQPKHVAALMNCVGSFLRRRGVRPRFVWCLELTRALKPHYHVLVWLPLGMTLPKPDKRGWWAWGSTRIEWARKAVGYLAKYASKATPETIKAIPKGARTHGVGGLGSESKRELRWWKSPERVRAFFGVAADIRKVVGGHVDACNGSFLRSPWHVHIGDRGRIYVWSDES